MADTNETIADIIAEMRRGTRLPGFWHSCDLNKILQYHADRLEAALKRELSKNTSKNGADFGQLGDAAKLREALCESRRIASDLGGCRLNDYWKLNEIVRVCNAALNAPPRNCDRYATAEEAIGAYRQTHKVSNLIQWPTAKYWMAQWNPVIGCKPCSPACENCYAAAWAKRFGQSFEPHKSSRARPPRKGVVFCGNMTDLFGEWSEGPMEPIFKTARSANADATYLYLTKRVECMCAMLNSIVMAQRGVNLTGLPFTDPRIFDNHYFGFTAENQEWYDRRRDALYHNWPSWANLWISAEPLLGPIDDMKLGNIVAGNRCRWLVVGCESGPNRRPCKIEWVESIVEQCLAVGVPVFVKQLSIGGKCETDINKFPAHLQIRQVPWAKEGGAK